MKKKQLFTFALALTLLFSLCGCSSKKAAAVDEMISGIGTVTLNSKEVISNARTAYDELSDRGKEKVVGVDLLESAETYYAALVAIEQGNIDEAKVLFTELGEYGDAAAYVEQMTSQIDGVSDKAYFLGMKLLATYNSTEYRASLQDQISSFVENDIEGNWEEIPIGDLADTLAATPFMQNVLTSINGIQGDGEQDSEFAVQILYFFNLVFDNAWGHRLENTECTSVYSSQADIYGWLIEDLDASTMEAIKHLDDFIPEIYTELSTCSNLEEFDYVEFMADLVLCKFELS